MTTKKYTKVVAGVFSLLLPLSSFLFTSCADLDYTEATNRNEEWTYNYFGDGIKNLVFDVYAQLYNNPPTRLSMHSLREPSTTM